MTKSEIRLQYSGFAIFIAKILSVATGLTFTLLLTRAITEGELGIWSNITDMIGYFGFLAPAIPFWALRFAARNKEGAIKTGIQTNLIISIIATMIYLPLIPLIMPLLKISEAYLILYLVASLQIVEIYFLTILEACLRAKVPHTIAYGLVIEESCKVVLAYALINKLQQPMLGALLSLIIAYGIQIAYYLKLIAPELKQSFKWDYVKEWLKGSSLNVYYAAGDRISTFSLIMLIIYGGQAARGQYQAAWTITNIIMYSSFLSFALYPKLLAENSVRDITTSLKTMLMFGIPMTAGAIALADSYLIILNEIYKDVTPVLIALAANTFVQIISQFFSSVLFGLEKIDEKAKVPLGKLAKSRVFIAFTLPYAHSAISLPTTFYALTTLARNDSLAAATYVAIIDTIARSAMFLILYAITRKIVKLQLPWKAIAKYIAVSALMAVILYVIPHPTRLYTTFGVTAAGAVFYLGLLAVIDKEVRTLVSSVWQEIKFRVKGKL